MAQNEFGPEELEVKLDGATVVLPAERRSFDSILAYLDSLALRRQRILCWLCVDGEAVNLTQGARRLASFSQIEAESMGPAEVPHQLIKGALQQTIAVRAKVQSAVELVLINNCARSRELWWSLSVSLKEPLLTLSLLPETICGPENGRASMAQLRKWQLQQLGGVIQAVDAACASDNSIEVADALEKRVLPWLDKLQDSLHMWSEAFSVRVPLPAASEAA
jgi:hypothetical protein